MFVKNIFLGPYPSPSRRKVAYTEENLHEMDELISTESKNGGKRILNTNSSAQINHCLPALGLQLLKESTWDLQLLKCPRLPMELNISPTSPPGYTP